MAAAVGCGRSLLRSSAIRNAAARFSASGPKSKTAAFPPSCFSKQKPLSPRILRSHAEMSCFCIESMLPYHTATSSALLTSMLSVSRRSCGWTAEDCNDDV